MQSGAGLYLGLRNHLASGVVNLEGELGLLDILGQVIGDARTGRSVVGAPVAIPSTKRDRAAPDWRALHFPQCCPA